MTNSKSIFCIVLLFAAAPCQAGVLNGRFEDEGAGSPFEHWETSTGFGFQSPLATTDSANDRYVLMDEAALGPASIGFQIAQEFLIPATASTLSFDFQMLTSGASGPNELPDAFQATLFDVDNLVVDPIFGPFGPGLLSIGEELFNDPFLLSSFFVSDDRSPPFLANSAVNTFASAADLRAGWTRVTLDIRSLRNRSVLLDFAFVDGFQLGEPVETQVSLDNVVIAKSARVIPEPASWVMFAFATLGVAATCRPLTSRVRRTTPVR